MLTRFIDRFVWKSKREIKLFDSLLIDLSAIMIWRGVWGLMDIYLFPNHAELSFISSILFGIALMLGLRKHLTR